MDTTQLAARKQRAARMNSVLKKLYPKAPIALRHRNGWELLVAVILSAQCTDERVNRVTEVLFKKYPTITDYAHARPRMFEQDIYSCGFYRNKTKNIIAAAQVIRNDFGGRIPETMEELLSVPGVARKTANVVLSNLYGKHVGIAVDTHVRRFAIKFDLTDYTDPVRIERDLMTIMPRSQWWQFNHRLVWYGREYCPARVHDCTKHPLTVIYPDAADRWPRTR